MLMRKKTWSTLACLLFSAVACGALLGCNPTGGGWIWSLGGAPAKAQFGYAFHVNRQNPNGEAAQVRGRLHYRDRGWTMGGDTVSLRGQLDEFTIYGLTFDADGGISGTPDFGMTTGVYEGDYEPQPARIGPGGRFSVMVIDQGEPGPSAGDSFSITLMGGVFDGYSHSGTLQGGNLQQR